MRILISGAARGLGFHLAREAVCRGHTVLAATRSASNNEALEALRASNPEHLEVFSMDVTDEDQVRESARRAEKLGALDGIVNNAAILVGREDTIESLDLDLVRRSMEVNLLGPMRVVQQFLPFIRKGNSPCIVNISSEAGTIVNAFSTNYPYAMSKTALNMFSERLRFHLMEDGIRVYAVHPGWMRTGMGGEDAPADPAVIAVGILGLLEGTTKTTSKISFIDATGRPMPL